MKVIYIETVDDARCKSSSVWNNGRQSAFAGQMYKTPGHFSLDFGENIWTKLSFYLN